MRGRRAAEARRSAIGLTTSLLRCVGPSRLVGAAQIAALVQLYQEQSSFANDDREGEWRRNCTRGRAQAMHSSKLPMPLAASDSTDYSSVPSAHARAGGRSHPPAPPAEPEAAVAFCRVAHREWRRAAAHALAFCTARINNYLSAERLRGLSGSIQNSCILELATCTSVPMYSCSHETCSCRQ